ncbi:MAG: alpha/beta fold hydrolase [Saprospiraceae bacterium]
MTLYLIPGLGADKRVFTGLTLNTKTQVLDWIEPLKNEPLSDYVKRLSAQIDTSHPFGVLGVSFGGIVAVELAKILKPKVTILISSVSKSKELPQHFIGLGKLGFLNLVPDALLKPPTALMSFMFGAKDTELLCQIIKDTSPTFLRWALNAILRWKSDVELPSVVRIHGTDDRLIPLKGEATTIKNGGHFMIVDRAEEVSEIVTAALQQVQGTALG